MQTYKIGTRGSLLAVTQSTLVKNQLEALSGDKFELVLIKTQGDEITSKPLWQLEGKDFFTKELDEALLKGEVDLVIHSYKDLGSERPAGIKLAAITERRFAHDVLLIRQETIEQLKNWDGEFVVGTSSPRRIVNIQRSLKPLLPFGKQESVNLRCETLRGNVNTRIRKLKEGQYHAIVLALAGVERLSHTDSSAAELQELLNGLNFFVLPLSVFPSAASQGALGIETREDRDDNGKLFNIISQLSHERTVEEVRRERKAFKEFGGGCHLAVGIHVRKFGEHFLHFHAGEVDGKRIELNQIEGVKAPEKVSSGRLFLGLPSGANSEVVYDEFFSKKPISVSANFENEHVFVTSRYCLPALAKQTPRSLWAAGVKTIELLAREGRWVNGTSDSMGTSELKEIKSSKALAMMSKDLNKDWKVLTHRDSPSDLGEVIGCYEREELSVTPEYEARLKEVTACYWTSFPQYQSFIRCFPFLKEATHFCGLGKTWAHFQKENIVVTPLASMDEFTKLQG